MNKNHITRAVILLMGAWGVLVVAFSEPVLWPFEWEWLLADIATGVLPMLLLPTVQDKPSYKGTLLTGNFFPMRHAWPVWVFWLALQALFFHAALATKILLLMGQIDYNIVRVSGLAVLLSLAYQGKLPGWKTSELK